MILAPSRRIVRPRHVQRVGLGLAGGATDHICEYSAQPANLTTGSVIFYCRPDNVNNNVRLLFTKVAAAADAQISCFRRLADGSSAAYQMNGGAQVHRVDTTTGTLVAGEWGFHVIVFDYGVNGWPLWFRGKLNERMEDRSTNPSTGNQSHGDDSGTNWSVGGDATGTFANQGFPGTFGFWGIYSRKFTLTEAEDLRELCMEGGDLLALADIPECEIFTRYGYDGRFRQTDWSRNRNHGRPHADVLIKRTHEIPMPRVRPAGVGFVAAPPAGGSPYYYTNWRRRVA